MVLIIFGVITLSLNILRVSFIYLLERESKFYLFARERERGREREREGEREHITSTHI